MRDRDLAGIAPGQRVMSVTVSAPLAARPLLKIVEQRRQGRFGHPMQ